MVKHTPAFTSHRAESLFERHAWKLLLVMSAIIVMFGVGDLTGGGATLQEGESVLMQGITGTTWSELQAANPRVANLVDFQVRSTGAALLSFGVLSAAVCLTGLRRGERWAWYAMWVWPMWMAMVVILTSTVQKVVGAGTPVPVISGSLFIVLSALSLLLSYRKYFQREH